MYHQVKISHGTAHGTFTYPMHLSPYILVEVAIGAQLRAKGPLKNTDGNMQLSHAYLCTRTRLIITISFYKT